MKRIIPALCAVFLLTGCSTSGEQPVSGMADKAETREVPTEPETEAETQAETETEPETAGKTVPTVTDERLQPADAKAFYDILLRASRTGILIGQDESEIIWYAEIPPDCLPQVVYLVDADTGEVVAELFDEADFEKYGDTIKGDSVYNCRFEVDVNIGSDPEVSEERRYHYYVEFTEDQETHRSDTKEIRVLEPFSDKELNDMETVDNAISALMDSAEYQALDDNEKLDKAIALLKELAAGGTADCPYSLIDAGSIVVYDDAVSFQYACGVGGAVKTRPFDEQMN